MNVLLLGFLVPPMIFSPNGICVRGVLTCLVVELGLSTHGQLSTTCLDCPRLLDLPSPGPPVRDHKPRLAVHEHICTS